MRIERSAGGRRAGAPWAVLPMLAVLAAWAVPAAAQEPRALSLQEALDLALAQSEQVEIARAGVLRAEGDVLRARAARLPQLNASLSYSRTLASQFDGLFGGGQPAPDPLAPPPPVCARGPFVPNPALPVEQRLDSLELAVRCQAAGGGFGGFDFSQAGFGAENTYNLGVSFSAPLFTGGRLAAQSGIAQAGQRVARVGLESAEAQLRLDVTQAYFDAQLADRLLEIAGAALEQAEETLRLTELAFEVGNQAEFDVLRARVTRDNQRPVVIQRRAARDLAYDRLRLFLDLGIDAPVVLSTRLEDVDPVDPAIDTAQVRAPVRQALQATEVQQAQLRIARAQRLPTLSIASQYGQVAFLGNQLPRFGDFRDNWTVGAAIQLPLFTGGRIQGDIRTAAASLVESEQQLRQTREVTLLDTRNTAAQLRAARATWEASQGTVEQAERAYEIATVRYREGISSQLELNDARLLLQQARVNRANAARELRVAQVRAELLPYLPVSVPSGIAPPARAGVTNAAGASRAAETQPPTQNPAVAPQGGGAPQGAGGGMSGGMPRG